MKLPATKLRDICGILRSPQPCFATPSAKATGVKKDTDGKQAVGYSAKEDKIYPVRECLVPPAGGLLARP
jgi:hypothetical protein